MFLPTMSLSSPQLQPITGGHPHQSTAAAIGGLDSSSHAALTDMQLPGLNNFSIALWETYYIYCGHTRILNAIWAVQRGYMPIFMNKHNIQDYQRF
jgi:hypothetical protein